MKIYVKLFKRKFDVNSSNKNVRKAYELQLSLAKVNSEKDPIKRAESQLAMVKSVPKFLGDVLHLNQHQMDQLDGMSFEETLDEVGYVSQRLMGLSDEQISAEEHEDPKK